MNLLVPLVVLATLGLWLWSYKRRDFRLNAIATLCLLATVGAIAWTLSGIQAVYFRASVERLVSDLNRLGERDPDALANEVAAIATDVDANVDVSRAIERSADRQRERDQTWKESLRPSGSTSESGAP